MLLARRPVGHSQGEIILRQPQPSATPASQNMSLSVHAERKESSEASPKWAWRRAATVSARVEDAFVMRDDELLDILVKSPSAACTLLAGSLAPLVITIWAF